MKDRLYLIGPDEHYHILGDAETFINWFVNESGLSDAEKIEELEYQRSQLDVSDYFKKLCTNAIDTIHSSLDYWIRCSQCGRPLSYKEARSIITGYKTHSNSEVISRSLFGGSTVRRISEYQTPIERCLCERCANEYYRRCKEDAEKHSIKGFFKKLFK